MQLEQGKINDLQKSLVLACKWITFLPLTPAKPTAVWWAYSLRPTIIPRTIGWAIPRCTVQPAAAILLFNDEEFRPWLAAYLTDYARTGLFLPACCQDIIRTATIRREPSAFSAAAAKSLDAETPAPRRDCTSAAYLQRAADRAISGDS